MLRHYTWESQKKTLQHYKLRQPETSVLYQIVYHGHKELQHVWQPRFQHQFSSISENSSPTMMWYKFAHRIRPDSVYLSAVGLPKADGFGRELSRTAWRPIPRQRKGAVRRSLYPHTPRLRRGMSSELPCRLKNSQYKTTSSPTQPKTGPRMSSILWSFSLSCQPIFPKPTSR